MIDTYIVYLFTNINNEHLTRTTQSLNIYLLTCITRTLLEIKLWKYDNFILMMSSSNHVHLIESISYSFEDYFAWLFPIFQYFSVLQSNMFFFLFIHMYLSAIVTLPYIILYYWLWRFLSYWIFLPLTVIRHCIRQNVQFSSLSALQRQPPSLLTPTGVFTPYLSRPGHTWTFTCEIHPFSFR